MICKQERPLKITNCTFLKEHNVPLIVPLIATSDVTHCYMVKSHWPCLMFYFVILLCMLGNQRKYHTAVLGYNLLHESTSWPFMSIRSVSLILQSLLFLLSLLQGVASQHRPALPWMPAPGSKVFHSRTVPGSGKR